MNMQIARALRASDASCVAFVGAGGKTSAMFRLARELESQTPVAVTASSHLGAWQTSLADTHIIAENIDALQRIEWNGVTLITERVENERTTPLNASFLTELFGACKRKNIPLLVEADGSRQKPLKAPAEHEPPIPAFADLVVLCAGLRALGQSLTEDIVHRAEIFARLGQTNIGDAITSQSLIRVLSHAQGGLKNIPSGARRVVLLNQADTIELQSAAQGISQSLLPAFDSVVISSLKENSIYATREPIAGIILAAGESKRFGSPKQLLDWKGKPFIHNVAETALHAGLRPILVVTGSHASDVESALRDLPVTIVHNELWVNGQSESIKAGIRALSANVGAAIFLLADQPQISVDIIHALKDAHSRVLSPIIAPLVREERRANPVLFDRDTFPDLLELSGDTGGRAIFHKHKVEYLPWHDDILLLDVDSPEDYKTLQERGSET